MNARPLVSRSILPKTTRPPEERPARVLVVEDGAGVARGALESFASVNVCRGDEPVADLVGILRAELVVIAAENAGRAIEICRAIRASSAGRTLPIILALAGQVDEHDVDRGLDAGADDVISGARPVELQARARVQLRNKQVRDRLHRVRAERDTYHVESKVDPLTGLCNRRTFEARLAQAHESGAPYALLFVDVDRFKSINDGHGHDVGDNVLRALAQCLYRNKRREDTVARWGGEEFVVLLRDANAKEALAQAEVHRRGVESLAVLPFRTGQITVSVGVATRRANDDRTAVCRRADAALYEAKRAGRNRVRLEAKR